MKESIGLTFILLVLSWMMFFYQGTVDYNVRRQAIGNIVYRYTQTAGKKGILNDVIYNELKTKLNIYGEYEIRVLAEKFENNNIIILEDKNVLNYDLRENSFDILTIYVESKKEHWLDKVLKMSPFGGDKSTDSQHNISAKSAVYIQ